MKGWLVMALIKKHILTILCVVSIILLALPIANLELSIDADFLGTIDSQVTLTGFNALKNSIFAYCLIVGPVLLVAMNYIKPLEKYKGLLAILIPVICMVSLIIVVISAKSYSATASAGDYSSAEVKIKIAIGAILLFVSYVGTIVAGAVIYHDFTLDKAGIEKLKDSAANIVSVAQEKITDIKVSSETENITASAETNSNAIDHSPKSQARKSSSLKHAEEVLDLIERLSRMKDNDILTEEEFTQKKKQLLDEI